MIRSFLQFVFDDLEHPWIKYLQKDPDTLYIISMYVCVCLRVYIIQKLL